MQYFTNNVRQKKISQKVSNFAKKLFTFFIIYDIILIERVNKSEENKMKDYKMKVYIVVDACSGEDYSCDDPTVLFVSTNKEEAEQFFEDEIYNWEDGMVNYDSHSYENEDDLIYECTDFEGDSHRIMKLISREVE